MSRRWRNDNIDQAQPKIVEALEACGDTVHFIGQPVDLLIRTWSLWWTCEVKTPGKNAKRRQKAQTDHEADCTENGALHFTVSSIDEVIAARESVIRRIGKPQA